MWREPERKKEKQKEREREKDRERERERKQLTLFSCNSFNLIIQALQWNYNYNERNWIKMVQVKLYVIQLW